MRPQCESTSFIPVCRQATTIEPASQHRNRRITFSSFAEKAAQRQEKHPPPNISKPDKPLHRPPAEREHSEVIRLDEAAAQERAFEHRKDFAHDVKGQFWRCKHFFTSTSRKLSQLVQIAQEWKFLL